MVIKKEQGTQFGVPGSTSNPTFYAQSITVGSGGINNGAGTNRVPVAVNSTASVTASQVASGYITSTSAAAVTMTLPTATAIAAVIGATQGTSFDLFIDNTAGANTVTVTPDSSIDQVASRPSGYLWRTDLWTYDGCCRC